MPLPSLRGAQRRSNPGGLGARPPLDCFAALAMTAKTQPPIPQSGAPGHERHRRAARAQSPRQWLDQGRRHRCRPHCRCADRRPHRSDRHDPRDLRRPVQPDGPGAGPARPDDLGGPGLRRALRADRARLRADLQGLRRVQLRPGHHGGVRGADAGRPLREGCAGLPRGHPDARRDVRAGRDDRARCAAPAGQPARHHPVHGDLRDHLLPDRLRRSDLRRQSQADDRRAALSAQGRDRPEDPRRHRLAAEDRHRRRHHRLADDRRAGAVLPVHPHRQGSAGSGR